MSWTAFLHSHLLYASPIVVMAGQILWAKHYYHRYHHPH
jgi:hypothetical protein